MATDLQPGVPGGVPTEKPSVFWLISGGGTIVSLLIGWWLYRHSIREGGGAMAAAASDAQG